MSSGNLRNVADREAVLSASASASLPPVNSGPTTTASPVVGPAQPAKRRWFGLQPGEWAAMLAVSAFVLTASYLGWWTITVTEAWGFVHRGMR